MEGLDPALLAAVSAAVLLASLLVLVLLRGKKGALSRSASSAQLSAAEAGEGESDKLRVHVLYGTQTGTSEKFAKEIGELIKQRYAASATVVVTDLEAFDEASSEQKLQQEQCAVFFQSTYGDGEPTDTAVPFFNWLEAAAEDGAHGDALSSLSYAVFGLGSTQYEHFNAAARALNKHLSAMGATSICDVGFGDDDKNIEEDFENWREKLWPALESAFPQLAGGAAAGGGAAPAPSEYVVEKASAAARTKAATGPHDAKNPYMATVTECRQLHTSESDRSCLHVEFDLSGSKMSYEHGDHLGVFAENSSAEVEAVAGLLGEPLDTAFTLRKPSDSSLGEPFPGPCTLRDALAKYADLLTPPRKMALAALAHYCADATEAEALRRIASDKAEYASFIEKPARTVREVLEAFPSCKPTLGGFFGSIVPRLQVRYYSISSSPNGAAGAQKAAATMAVVRGPTSTGRVHEGVCTTFVERAGVGAKVPVYFRGSSFKLPADASKPVIMIGPGTGLAPFRGFLEERAHLKAQGKTLGPATFFFGCRARLVDFIYEAELQGYLEAGVLGELHVAFSREGKKKVYVQHHLAEQGAAIWQLLEQGAYVYVCGDAANMAKDVHRALHDIIITHGKRSGNQAEMYVKQLTDAGRYQRDVW